MKSTVRYGISWITLLDNHLRMCGRESKEETKIDAKGLDDERGSLENEWRELNNDKNDDFGLKKKGKELNK